jgi:predicted lipoprotein with Yx(FWY)xxD motif
MFAATAHTEAASATAVNGIPAVTVDAGVMTVLTYAPADERATWSAVELPRANTWVPYATLPRRGR